MCLSSQLAVCFARSAGSKACLADVSVLCLEVALPGRGEADAAGRGCYKARGSWPHWERGGHGKGRGAMGTCTSSRLTWRSWTPKLTRVFEGFFWGGRVDLAARVPKHQYPKEGGCKMHPKFLPHGGEGLAKTEARAARSFLEPGHLVFGVFAGWVCGFQANLTRVPSSKRRITPDSITAKTATSITFTGAADGDKADCKGCKV